MPAGKYAVLMLGLVLSCAGTAHGDVFSIENQGNTIFPLDEMQVSMDSEVVVVESIPKETDLLVTCTFKMTNRSPEALTRTVAFPVVDARYAEFMKKNFLATVDGRRCPTVLTMATADTEPKAGAEQDPEQEPLPYPGVIQWEVSWAPGQTRTLGCSYRTGMPDHVFGLGYGRRLRYVVKTGALWQGKIGTAEITFRFANDPRRYANSTHPESVVRRTTYPDNVEWLSDKELRWRFEDWEPEEDIFLELYTWRGLPERIYWHFALPEKYEGDARAYTDAYLDESVQREIEPWEAIFPEQVKTMDRAALRKAIADIFYHEIFARHKYAFVIGKQTGTSDNRPIGVSRALDGTLFGPWYGYFAREHGLHGGWYRADRGKTLHAALEELNEIERANLAFLLKCGATDDVTAPEQKK